MWNLLSIIQKNLTISIPAAMITGIATGTLINPEPLKNLIVPLTFLMVYPMMVNLELKKVFSGGDVKLQSAAQIINFGIIPFIAFGTGKLFFSENPMAAFGLLLAALLPTSGMTISWTGFARGNINSAVKMTVIGLIAGSLLTPLYGKWLMGAVIEIPLVQVFKQIILIVFLPMALGFATKQILFKYYGAEHYNAKIKQKFPPLSTLGVLGIVFTAMALKAESIMADPLQLMHILIPVVLLYTVNFLISTAAGKLFFERGDAIALVYGTVMRNLSIALAIAMITFGKEGADIALVISAAYIVQVQAAGWYVKHTDRIFGFPLCSRCSIPENFCKCGSAPAEG